MQQKLRDSIEFLRNREGLFLVLVAALIVQAPHSAEVFHRASTSQWPEPLPWLHATGFALVLELAVLLFVVRGRKELSWGFASISVLMNVFYYYSNVWWVWVSVPVVVECIVISVSLPLAIAFYSHEVADPTPSPTEKDTVQDPAPTTQDTVDTQSDTQHTTPPVGPEDTVPPTPWQERAIQLRSEGLSYKQIGDEVGKHENTVRNLFVKLNHKETV